MKTLRSVLPPFRRRPPSTGLHYVTKKLAITIGANSAQAADGLMAAARALRPLLRLKRYRSQQPFRHYVER